MAYNENQKATLKHLVSLATKAKTAISTAIANLPVEMFVDATKTKFIQSFAFTAETYPNSTDPNLNGKPVLVLAVKSVDNTTKAETMSYSFLNMETLVDYYSAKDGDSAKILNIADFKIEIKFDGDTLEATTNGLTVRVSSKAGNALSVDEDGGLYVDISGKADKVENATAGHLAGLDANGNPTDSGIVASEVLTTADVATDAEVEEALNGVFGTNS